MPDHPPIDARCDHCRHWRPYSCEDHGTCRANAPSAKPGDLPLAVWPITLASDVCGQWAIKPELVSR